MSEQTKPEYIHTYIRNRKRERIGVALATKDGVGWSKCAVKRGDKFDRNTGIEIALVRARENNIKLSGEVMEIPANMPEDVVKHVFKIAEQAQRRFPNPLIPAKKTRTKSKKTSVSSKSVSTRKNLSRKSKVKITTKAILKK